MKIKLCCYVIRSTRPLSVDQQPRPLSQNYQMLSPMPPVLPIILYRFQYDWIRVWHPMTEIMEQNNGIISKFSKMLFHGISSHFVQISSSTVRGSLWLVPNRCMLLTCYFVKELWNPRYPQYNKDRRESQASFRHFKTVIVVLLNLCQLTCVSWRRHQMETFSALLALMRGIHRSPVNSPHKGQWRGALVFYLICAARINGWVNNREAGDLRRHRGHYDVNVMYWLDSCCHTVPNFRSPVAIVEAHYAQKPVYSSCII